MNWKFPQDRLVYSYYTGSPLYPVAAGTRLTVYLDQECTQLAPITDLNTMPIVNSVITIGNDTLLPLFVGPADVVELWVKPQGATDSYRLDAVLADRIDQISTSNYVHTQDVAATIWTVHHNLGYFPSITIVDTDKNEIRGDVTFLDTNTVQIDYFYQISGQAFCS